MPSTAIANATLTAIAAAAAGGTDTYEGTVDPNQPGPAVWEGRAGCWYAQQVDRRTGAEGSSRTVIHRLTVPDLRTTDGGRLELAVGQVLTFAHVAGPAVTGTIQEVVRLPGPDGTDGETRLVFEPA